MTERQRSKPKGVRVDMAAELSQVALGDARLDRRLTLIASRVAVQPAKSFPNLCESESELEGLYRFLGNERVKWADVLRPHILQTIARCQAARRIVVLHDSSEFSFKSDTDARENLGYLPHGHRGFLGHVALAAALDGDVLPLGVLGFEPVVQPKPKGKSHEENVRLSNKKKPEEKRSRRWARLAGQVEERLGDVEAIHVMDREADIFEVLSMLVEGGHQCVIRARFDRGIVGEDEQPMSSVLSGVEGELLREIEVAPRKTSARKHHIRRTGRAATLLVRGARVNLLMWKHRNRKESVQLNVVEVFEKDAPSDEEPLSWTLYTTLPIGTVEQLAAVVDIYRRRWLIEEYFKALKTGCSYERRQLMTLHGLLNTFALLAPIAWRILLLRGVGRSTPEAPATHVLSEDELQLLRRLSVRVVLSKEPDADEVLRAIAGLGGHLKRNGPPGWQTIWRGFEQLLGAKRGWDVAVSEM
jgi:hypothetical protein